MLEREYSRLGASDKELDQLRDKAAKSIAKAKPPRNAKAADRQLQKDLAAVAKLAGELARIEVQVHQPQVGHPRGVGQIGQPQKKLLCAFAFA